MGNDMRTCQHTVYVTVPVKSLRHRPAAGAPPGSWSPPGDQLLSAEGGSARVVVPTHSPCFPPSNATDFLEPAELDPTRYVHLAPLTKSHLSPLTKSLERLTSFQHQINDSFGELVQ